HHEAKKCRSACKPVYLASRIGLPDSSWTTFPAPSFFTTDRPAAIMVGTRTRLIRLAWDSIVPLPVGNTRSSFPVGHASLHSRRHFSRGAGIGTVRSPAADFGAPISE